MAQRAGRVGVNPADVDPVTGHVNVEVPGNVYTKTQVDNKFLTKTKAASDYQTKELEVPVQLLDGSALTVEAALNGLNNLTKYEAGDVVRLAGSDDDFGVYFGYVSFSTSNIIVVVDLDRYINSDLTQASLIISTITARGNKGYFIDSGTTFSGNYKITEIRKVNNTQIHIKIAKSDDTAFTNVDNNTPVVIALTNAVLTL